MLSSSTFLCFSISSSERVYLYVCDFFWSIEKQLSIFLRVVIMTLFFVYLFLYIFILCFVLTLLFSLCFFPLLTKETSSSSCFCSTRAVLF